MAIYRGFLLFITLSLLSHLSYANNSSSFNIVNTSSDVINAGCIPYNGLCSLSQTVIAPHTQVKGRASSRNMSEYNLDGDIYLTNEAGSCLINYHFHYRNKWHSRWTVLDTAGALSCNIKKHAILIKKEN